jgi:hypothetical protein
LRLEGFELNRDPAARLQLLDHKRCSVRCVCSVVCSERTARKGGRRRSTKEYDRVRTICGAARRFDKQRWQLLHYCCGLHCRRSIIAAAVVGLALEVVVVVVAVAYAVVREVVVTPTRKRHFVGEIIAAAK